jgi:ribosomal protein S18 acetylase RimI-like enzyme
MPAIEIRPAKEEDISTITQFDHSYTTDHVWQMDRQLEMDTEEPQFGAFFRKVRLPRSVHVDYPRNPKLLVEDWNLRSALLVAVLNDEVVGYTSLAQNNAISTIWMTDLIVTTTLRRHGIGSALVLAALEWSGTHPYCRRLVLEMQPKNHPAIRLAQKMRFEFCGYNDHYYSNNDIALHFARWSR